MRETLVLSGLVFRRKPPNWTLPPAFVYLSIPLVVQDTLPCWVLLWEEGIQISEGASFSSSLTWAALWEWWYYSNGINPFISEMGAERREPERERGADPWLGSKGWPEQFAVTMRDRSELLLVALTASETWLGPMCQQLSHCRSKTFIKSISLDHCGP